MRVVVTGARGNMGSALIHRLRVAGKYDIVALARRTPDHCAVNGPEWASIARSPYSWSPVTRGVPWHGRVVDLAWAFQPSHRVRYLGPGPGRV